MTVAIGHTESSRIHSGQLADLDLAYVKMPRGMAVDSAITNSFLIGIMISAFTSCICVNIPVVFL